MNKVTVIGAGLAGCEAAFQLAKRGYDVSLYEMKPIKYSPAHHYEGLAELVCSNSLRSDSLTNAVGLLKEEMRRIGSVIMQAADACRVPAGGSLAVDRYGFSDYVTRIIKSHPHIQFIEGEVTDIDITKPTIVATGPLTSEKMAEKIHELVGKEQLSFFDAAAPILTRDSIDFSVAFMASRYDKGEADYINCPMNREQYEAFYEALIHAEAVELKSFENKKVFEGCMPVEVMASRGQQTLLFGPLKPVGITNPKTGKDDFYAVVQLRQDNKDATLYNMVGFQTHLKFGEQKRVFSMIPGLEHVEFMRYGVMHRNTYIESPHLLNEFYQMKQYPSIFFAGQMTGVEGYIESAASGLVAGLNMARRLAGKPMIDFGTQTAIGSMAHYISSGAVSKFQPMNANFGLIDSLPTRIRNKKERYEKISERALSTLNDILPEIAKEDTNGI